MDVNLQEKEENSTLPVLARTPTYGERVYNFIFGNVINFWVNLAVSAGFTYFVKHSKQSVLGMGNPDTIYHNTANGLHNIVKHAPGLSESAAKGTSKVMTDALLLTTGGTVVMVPSIWLGEKIKAPMVKWLDRMHYGKDTVAIDESIQARHTKLDTDPKPTLLGAVVGRFGAMLVVQLSAFTIGYKDNWISGLGKKIGSSTLQKFHGVDSIAEKIGDGVGHGIASVTPVYSAKLNDTLHKAGFGEAGKTVPSNTGRALEDFSKYTSADMLYTLMTALSIGPIIGALKKLPGMSYRDKQPEAKPAAQPVRAASPRAQTTAPRKDDEKRTDVPHIRVSDIKHAERVSAPETALAQGGIA